MAGEDRTLAEAVAAADAAAPPPTVVDLMPRSADTLAGRKASPVNAASLRFLQAVESVEGALPPMEQGTFILFCRVRSGTPRARADLWRLARNPPKLWQAYIDWMEALPADEFNTLMEEHMKDWAEVGEASGIIDGGDEGDEGNATGSPS